ncbi:hypothetical protein HZB07_02535 [Candidatus Saganbacteria bacterium]|nr:hypothetical protein [Candidatus Saganbacteria bacterium]
MFDPRKKLKIIPAYTGLTTLKEVLKDERAQRLLWLEILFNDTIDWRKFKRKILKKAYKKASLWYGHFKTMIDNYVGREPLKAQRGRIDGREYRTFLEALNLVTA